MTPLLETANRLRREFVRHRNADHPSEIRVIDGPGCEGGRDAPVLSVIIPTRDGDARGRLPKLLEQIRRQSLARHEVILVKGDPRQGRAINTGAALARAELLLTLDDDARLNPEDLFERLVQTLTARSDIAMAGVPNLIPDDAPWLARMVMEQVPRKRTPPVQTITDSDLAEHGCLAIRRSVFYQVGGEHEFLPRGLDPYLRSEIRKTGARIVVIPGVWYHHLPPEAVAGLVKQCFRNGVQAAYCQKFFPQWVIETPARHTADFAERVAFPRRAARYAIHIVVAFLTLRWIYLASLLVYAAGFLYGWVTAQRGDRLPPR